MVTADARVEDIRNLLNRLPGAMVSIEGQSHTISSAVYSSAQGLFIFWSVSVLWQCFLVCFGFVSLVVLSTFMVFTFLCDPKLCACRSVWVEVYLISSTQYFCLGSRERVCILIFLYLHEVVILWLSFM